MCVRRLVGACSYAVADRMRRLTWVTTLGNSRSGQAIQFRKARAILRAGRGFVENFQQDIEQAVILSGKLAGTNIFR